MAFVNRIVAAANKYNVTTPDGSTQELVIVDAGHFCDNMQATIKLLKSLGCTLKLVDDDDRGQGFIDESSNYHNRSEGYKIAKASGQEFNDEFTLPNDKLDSSCIRHFITK